MRGKKLQISSLYLFARISKIFNLRNFFFFFLRDVPRVKFCFNNVEKLRGRIDFIRQASHVETLIRPALETSCQSERPFVHPRWANGDYAVIARPLSVACASLYCSARE